MRELFARQFTDGNDAGGGTTRYSYMWNPGMADVRSSDRVTSGLGTRPTRPLYFPSGRRCVEVASYERETFYGNCRAHYRWQFGHREGDSPELCTRGSDGG